MGSRTILGGMTAFDMGGPINKVADPIRSNSSRHTNRIMGGVGIAIVHHLLGMALATFLFKNKFSKQEQEAGKAAAISGSIGISEGVILSPAANAPNARAFLQSPRWYRGLCIRLYERCSHHTHRGAA